MGPERKSNPKEHRLPKADRIIVGQQNKIAHFGDVVVRDSGFITTLPKNFFVVEVAPTSDSGCLYVSLMADGARYEGYTLDPGEAVQIYPFAYLSEHYKNQYASHFGL
jgi:hypothetical protein